MLSAAFSLLVVTMALSVVMLFVLHSLAHSDAKGVRDWSLANGLAVIALPLFALRGRIPDLVSIEVANTLLMGTGAMMVAGIPALPRQAHSAAPAAGLHRDRPGRDRRIPRGA